MSVFYQAVCGPKWFAILLLQAKRLETVQQLKGKISSADEDSYVLLVTSVSNQIVTSKTLLISRTPNDHRTASVRHERCRDTFHNTNGDRRGDCVWCAVQDRCEKTRAVNR